MLYKPRFEFRRKVSTKSYHSFPNRKEPEMLTLLVIFRTFLKKNSNSFQPSSFKLYALSLLVVVVTFEKFNH